MLDAAHPDAASDGGSPGDPADAGEPHHDAGVDAGHRDADVPEDASLRDAEVADAGADGGVTEPSCGEVPSGASEARVRYAHAMVDFGSSCASEQQTRVCFAGQWSAWSGSFASESCAVRPPASCDGQADGTEETRVRYAQQEVSSGVCTSETQTRSCNNGSWSAWSGSYAYLSCTVCTDADGDRRGAGCSQGADCDDANPAIFVGAPEIDWNQSDDDCDGVRGRHLEIVSRLPGGCVGDGAARLDRGVLVSLWERLEMRAVDALDEAQVIDPSFLQEHPIVWWDLGAAWDWQLQAGVLVATPYKPGSLTAELWLFDASDTSQAPVPRASLLPEPTVYAYVLSADGQRLYVDAAERLLAYDLSDLDAPVLLGELEVPCPQQVASYGIGSLLADDGETLLLSCGTGLWAARASDGLPDVAWQQVSGVGNVPRVAGFTDHGTFFSSGANPATSYVYRVEWSGSDAPRGVLLTTLATAELHPAWEGSELVADPVATRDGVYFVRDRQLCLRPSGGAADRCIDLYGMPSVLLVEGERAVVGSAIELTTYDFSGSEVTRGAARRSFGCQIAGVHVEGSFAYLRSGGGISVADLRVPAPSEPLSCLSSGAFAGGFFFHEGHAYGSPDDGYTRIADFTTPAAPRWLKRFASGWRYDSVLSLRSHQARVLTLPTEGTVVEKGVRVWSIDAPAEPVALPHYLFDDAFLAEAELPYPRSLHDDGTYLYSWFPDVYGGRLEVFRYEDDALTWLRFFRNGGAWFESGRFYRIDEGSRLRVTDATSGAEQVAGAYHAGPSIIHSTGEDILLAEGGIVFNHPEWYEPHELYAYDELGQRLLWAELPAEADGCRPLAAGGGYFFCEGESQVWVMRATP